jgi:hypothetical protein
MQPCASRSDPGNAARDDGFRCAHPLRQQSRRAARHIGRDLPDEQLGQSVAKSVSIDIPVARRSAASFTLRPLPEGADDPLLFATWQVSPR